MDYAARPTSALSPRRIAVPLAALVLGAGLATGAYALTDDDTVVTQPASAAASDSAATDSGIELRGSKASATGTPATESKDSRPGRLGRTH